jgi:diacylglycerol O-acyltransferase / wax synthase
LSDGAGPLVQLSGLDAGFLVLESPRAPMTVGGLSILDPGSGADRLDVHRLRTLLASRLSRAVAFRRRLAALPFDLARPYWVELDPSEVDLATHVEATELPAPGGFRELSALMAWELGQQLDRSRPLWKITFVEGVKLPEHPRGSVALVATVHHAAIDGVSGAQILAALFDLPSDATDAGETAPRAAAAVPRTTPVGALELLARAGRDAATVPLRATRVVGRSLLGLAVGAVGRLRSEAPPPLPFAAPRSVLNRPLGGRLGWSGATLPLDRIKTVKVKAEASVNDVVLAVCAGALRRFLDARGELPADSLVAMVPISVRASEDRAAAGNQVSAMLVPLATTVGEPRERLLAIRDAARASKVAHQAIGARTLLESAELLPFAAAGLGAQLYSRLQLAARHRPPFNVVITNVPGPPRPLTVAGAPLLAHYGSAPLYDGLGLVLTVMSYAGTVYVGATADHDAIADVAGFAAELPRALDELAAAVG